MSNPLRLHSGRRRIIAAGVVIAVIAGLLIFGTMGYAHLARTHVTVSVTDNDEIVQIFVNCEFAADYAYDRPTTSSKDLGWLESGAIVTVQIRGWRTDGFYSVSIDHGSGIERIGDPGAASRGAPILADRLIREISMTASGRRLSPSGCQADSRARLPFAASVTGKWNGAHGAPLTLAAKLAPVARWALTLVGLLVLVVMGIRDLLMDRSRVTFTKVAFLLEAFVAVYSMVNEDLGLAFALCRIVGAWWIVVVLYRLLVDDFVTLGSWWLGRHSGGGAGTADPSGSAVSGVNP